MATEPTTGQTTGQTGAQSGAEASPGPEGAAPQAAEGDAEQAAPVPPKPELDDMKRKFREALERKRGSHARAEGVDHTGKVHGSHGPATSRRSFRRKSGG